MSIAMNAGAPVEEAVEPDPAAIASLTQDPLVEILVSDVRSSMPEAWQRLLDRAETRQQVCDWLALATLQRLMADAGMTNAMNPPTNLGDPITQVRHCVDEYAARVEPRRSRAWLFRDRLGLFLALAFVVAVLVARRLLFGWLAFCADWCPSGTADAPEILVTTLGTIAGLSWFALESIAVPRLMEILRQVPLRLARLPSTLSTRTDAFYVAWIVQAELCQILVLARCVQQYVTFGTALSLSQFAAFAICVGILMWTLSMGIGSPGVNLKTQESVGDRVPS